MKDSEARGLVLKRLYDLRHEKDQVDPNDFADIPIAPNVIPNIIEQLTQQNLANWKPLRSGRGQYVVFMARITAFGVDVVEGTRQSPISITIDSSVNVHGSQNVQIGQGNVQTVTMDIGKMINAVDGSNANATEKAEAKSLLAKIASNELVKKIIKKYFSALKLRQRAAS